MCLSVLHRRFVVGLFVSVALAGCVLSFDGLGGGASARDVDASNDSAGPPEGGAGTADVIDGSAVADDAGNGTLSVRDDFSGPTINTANWIAPSLFNNAIDPELIVHIVEGRLQMELRSDVAGSHYTGAVSAFSFNFTGAGMFVAGRNTADTTSRGLGMTVGTDKENIYEWFVGDGQIYALKVVAGRRVDLGKASYDSKSMEFLGLRHVVSTDEIVWATAPAIGDAPGTWTDRYRAPREFGLQNSKLQLFAGTHWTRSDAGWLGFDNFSLSRSFDAALAQ